MSLDLTITDLFCGAGGSSIGAERAGAVLKMAANHWKLAIETHSANFPDAAHDCADISQVDPRRYPSTDILLASPECTTHSQARSKKHVADLFNPVGDPAVERSRATMWDVPRFVEQHDYQAVVVENVVEIMRWPPIEGWFLAMANMGYKHKTLSVNSMVVDPPLGLERAPQSRDRVYIGFWKEGNRAPDFDLRPDCWCPKCETSVEGIQTWKNNRRVGRYRQQYLYRCSRCAGAVWPLVSPAAAAIDWSIPCPRIGDRAKPLADATMRRIRLGVKMLGTFVMDAAHSGSDPSRVHDPSEPLTTILAGGNKHALVVPLHHDARARVAATEPWPTQTGRAEQALVVPLRRNGRAFPVGAEPMPTFAAGGMHHGLFVMKNYGDGTDPSMCKPVVDPLGAITGQDHHSLVAMPFLTTYYGNGGTSPVNEPMPTVTTRDRCGLVQPAIEVDDCGLRMLGPPEVGRGMAFPVTYEVKGSKRDQVRQYGNAVTPPVSAWAVNRLIESLA